MARPPATPEERAARRAELQRAAMAVYAEHGEGITARLVAERAGCSPGTIYSHFGNLADLMRSLWVDPVEAAGERMSELASATPDPVERLRLLLEEYVRFGLDHPAVYRGALLTLRDRSGIERQPAQALPFVRLVTEAITEAQAEGRARSGDPEHLALLLWAGVHGAFGLSANIDIFQVETPSVLAPDMVPLLLEGLVIQPT